MQPTEKPRSVGPHKLKLKKITNKKKSRLKNKKFRSVSMQLRRWSAEPSSDGKNIRQQRLFYTNRYLKNYPFIDTSTSIPIVTLKLIKNRSNILNNKPLSCCSSYSRNNQRFKLDVKSSSIPVKDIELFYCLIRRLLFKSKITRPDIQACVTYVLTMMKLRTNYHKDRTLNTDISFIKKICMFILSFAEDWCTHLETLFSKHNNFMLIVPQQIIQSRRLKNVSTILEGSH